LKAPCPGLGHLLAGKAALRAYEEAEAASGRDRELPKPLSPLLPKQHPGALVPPEALLKADRPVNLGQYCPAALPGGLLGYAP
jgi:hypothetical protein